MHDPQIATADAPAMDGTPGHDTHRQLAQHDAAISALKHRLAAASTPRPRFSFQALYKELSLEAEISAAREERGALLHDQMLAEARA